MTRTFTILFVLLLAVVSVNTGSAFAGQGEADANCRRPYGAYCRGPRWGWYGANMPVTTVTEARKHLEKYFEGQKVTIGTVNDNTSYFEAEITDADRVVVDRVIIDKRTGRIRSVY